MWLVISFCIDFVVIGVGLGGFMGVIVYGYGLFVLSFVMNVVEFVLMVVGCLVVVLFVVGEFVRVFVFFVLSGLCGLVI